MSKIMSKGSSTKDLSTFESEWFESKDDINEREPENVKHVMIELLQKSSVYAVSQLVTSNGLGRRLLWFVVLIIGLLGCSYEICHFLSLYFQYPVVITLEVKNSWKLDFPAVTVCNLNRVPNRQYKCILQDLSSKVCSKRKKFRPLSTERLQFAKCSDDTNGTYSVERSQSLTFMNKYLKIDETERKDYGYKAEDFITSCTFNGDECSVSNFTQFSSTQFGNCFIFNWHYNDSMNPLQTPYIGPNSGLELSLYVNGFQYAPITTSVGARVVIHESDVQPNPEDDGINISPGYETSVALQQTSIYRLPDPYIDKCRKYKGETDSDKSQTTCIRNCMQNANFHECGCVDPFMPSQSWMHPCDLENHTEVCCLDKVMEALGAGNVSCSCPLPCKSTNYEMTISIAEWPAERFFQKFLKENFKTYKKKMQTYVKSFLHAHAKRNETAEESEHFNSTSATDDDDCCAYKDCGDDYPCLDLEPLDEYRHEYAKLKVFFRSLEKIYYKQEPMFQDSELFSQLGGQLGLWLGISLVALFECVENLIHLVHYLFKKTTKPKRIKSYFQNDLFNRTTEV